MNELKLEVITEEMFADWLEHPVTEVIRGLLAKKRLERKDDWESGDALKFGKDEQMLRNAAAIGECQGFRFVQELTLEQLKGELDD